MDKLLAALARRLEDAKGEPSYINRLTLLILALCVLAALLL